MTFDVVQFCKDWNAGLSVQAMADKYKLSKASVRGRINVLRKRGVELQQRRTQYLSNMDAKRVAEINSAIRR